MSRHLPARSLPKCGVDMKDWAALTLILFAIVTVIAAVAGWVMNIMAIIQIANDPIGGMFIFRCLGVIIAPLGAVLGWV